jgi:DNA-binding transcriptional regulator YhcF (GntR family)
MLPVTVIRALMADKLWHLSPLALKLALFLAANSEHPDVTVRDRMVRRGQYLRSLSGLGAELRVDYRTLRKALLELTKAGYVSIDIPTSRAVRNRQEQLINFSASRELQTAPARSVGKRVSFGNRTHSAGSRTSPPRRPPNHSPVGPADPAAQAELTLRARARAKAAREGITFDEALIALTRSE